MPSIAPAGAKPPAPLQWTPEDIALAQARCTALLKGLEAVAVPETPIREGTECGAAAPMKLLSVGRSPPVSLSPPPVVTCDMIAALGRWLERDVQPLARKHLGAPVIRIETMSSYSCRNAYGRKDSRLSE
ncbi:MAG TPA: extensin family protein, partial [Hyphomicrobiaceae bacterium]|nr:extensin family protein [Hyphomicrobiaceae bacterium]